MAKFKKGVPRGPSPFKGHPKSEWGAIKERLKADKAVAASVSSGEKLYYVTGSGGVGGGDPTAGGQGVGSGGGSTDAQQFMQQVHQPKKKPDANFKPPESNVSLDVPVAQPANRVSRPNLFSGKVQKLVLIGKNGSLEDPIPGYRTHWFVDQANSGVRINQAKASGWEFIRNDEVELNEGLVGGNNDLGSHVRQIAGSENGNPFYMYAMKKPLWLEAEHQAEYTHRAIDPVKEALIRGRLPGARPEDRQYAAGDQIALTTRSGLPPISIGTKTYR